jgi:hypothetical protein
LSLRNALRDDACATVLWTGGLLKRAPVNGFCAAGEGVKKRKRRKRRVFSQKGGVGRTLFEKLREAEFILP